MRTHTNPNWGVFYEITEQCSSKVYGHESQRQAQEMSSFKGE